MADGQPDGRWGARLNFAATLIAVVTGLCGVWAFYRTQFDQTHARPASLVLGGDGFRHEARLFIPDRPYFIPARPMPISLPLSVGNPGGHDARDVSLSIRAPGLLRFSVKPPLTMTSHAVTGETLIDLSGVHTFYQSDRIWTVSVPTVHPHAPIDLDGLLFASGGRVKVLPKLQQWYQRHLTHPQQVVFTTVGSWVPVTLTASASGLPGSVVNMLFRVEIQEGYGAFEETTFLIPCRIALS